ncbi:PAS domain-containing hybrid sensor histidine kinase/response regulator [Colwellia sp. 75C3]|uniref:PAS domain-containing hybrid sensor histidine kinase/response regulator n=1 Tax=Colwellia sp. 75C3 TaxID=888425 RepID=UPI0018E384AC|nr:PAS domain-containing sensor histidine kinase [Colwellia sp. 75C3]
MQADLDAKDELIKSLRAELKAAQENEHRLTTLIQAAPICIHEINLKGQITSMNGTGLNMMNMQREEEVCGINYMDFVCEKQKFEINTFLEQAYQGQYHAFEFSPEDSKLTFSSCFAPVFNENGVVEKIMGLTENVTEQRKQERKSRESEIKFRSIFDNADVSILNEDMSELKSALDQLRQTGVTDLYQYLRDHPQKIFEFTGMIKVIDVNNATLKMFNLTSEENFLEQISASFTPAADEVFIKELCAIWDGEKVFRSEATFISQVGNNIDSILSYHIPASKEGFKSVAVSIVDITLQKQVEEELFKSRKLKSVGLLAGGIAHDFNNILAGLFGHLELAKLKLPPEHAAYQHIKTANQAMDRATNLTNQLLTFAKGGDPLFEIIDVKQIIRDSIELSLSGSGVKTILTLPKDLWMLNADRGQLSQVLTNLLINAVHAMPRGGTLTIEAINIKKFTHNIIPHISGEFVGLKISDQGIGISDEQQKHIFDPYFTTKQSGSGLGLATAHSIIAKHNGYISVESELGKGTTFSIYLPAKSDAKISDKALLNDKRNVIESSGNVLLMDDEEMILDISSEMLEALGYSVVTAIDGKKAVEKYIDAQKCGRPFDVVIMDLTIPGGKGGEEVITELLDINPQVKAIVSSGYSTGKIMSNHTNYGFKGRLVKPFRMKVLENELYKILD